MEKVAPEKFLGIIPARYASTRLEGKPLVDIEGKTMIQRVYEQVTQVLPYVYVATDDVRILETVNGFGGKAVMTGLHHTTGTSRCLEAAEKVMEMEQRTFEVIINIQGDEPMLHPSQVTGLMDCFHNDSPEMATLVIPVTQQEDLFNESEAFVVFDKNRNALYFSRSVIPFKRDVPKEKWLEHHTYYKHLGMYAYTLDALRDFAALPHGSLEKSEMLEQNRWLEEGRKIKLGITEHNTTPVDTPEDLKVVRELIRAKEQKLS